MTAPAPHLIETANLRDGDRYIPLYFADGQSRGYVAVFIYDSLGTNSWLRERDYHTGPALVARRS